MYVHFLSFIIWDIQYMWLFLPSIAAPGSLGISSQEGCQATGVEWGLPIGHQWWANGRTVGVPHTHTRDEWATDGLAPGIITHNACVPMFLTVNTIYILQTFEDRGLFNVKFWCKAYSIITGFFSKSVKTILVCFIVFFVSWLFLACG